MTDPNAVVEYVDAATGAVVGTDEFHDPGLSRGVLVYGCGRALRYIPRDAHTRARDPNETPSTARSPHET